MQIVPISKIESTKEVVNFIRSGLKEFKFPYDLRFDKDLDDLNRFYSLPKANLLVLMDNKKIIGTIGVVYKNKPVAVLQRFYLKKNCRRKGFGKLLYQEIEKTITNQGYKKIMLNTTTRNKEAIAFFNKEGFKLVRKKVINLFFEKEI